MNKFNSLKDSSDEKNDRNQENQQNNDSNKRLGKVLCNHCGRTISNGIRCLGICVSDNDY